MENVFDYQSIPPANWIMWTEIAKLVYMHKLQGKLSSLPHNWRRQCVRLWTKPLKTNEQISTKLRKFVARESLTNW